MIPGILFCAFGLFHGVIKYSLIRSVSRDVLAGGTPVMDFVIFVPLWLSVGASSLLDYYSIHPFPGFGFAAYFGLAALFYGVMELEDRLGKPERERQLRAIQQRKNAGQRAAADGEDPAVEP